MAVCHAGPSRPPPSTWCPSSGHAGQALRPSDSTSARGNDVRASAAATCCRVDRSWRAVGSGHPHRTRRRIPESRPLPSGNWSFFIVADDGSLQAERSVPISGRRDLFQYWERRNLGRYPRSTSRCIEPAVPASRMVWAAWGEFVAIVSPHGTLRDSEPTAHDGIASADRTAGSPMCGVPTRGRSGTVRQAGRLAPDQAT